MALNKEEASNSLFGNFKKQKVSDGEISRQPQMIVDETVSEELKAKWQILDRVTVLLSTPQKEGLDRLAKRIMKNRSKSNLGKEQRERITANTLIRALVDNLLEKEPENMSIINTEMDAKAWIRKVLES